MEGWLLLDPSRKPVRPACFPRARYLLPYRQWLSFTARWDFWASLAHLAPTSLCCAPRATSTAHPALEPELRELQVPSPESSPAFAIYRVMDRPS